MMSTPDAANGQESQSLAGAPDSGAEHLSADASFSTGGWGEDQASAFDDLSGGNLFSAEIENVSPSDWDDDASHIWDDGNADVAHDHGNLDGLGFAL